MKKLSLAFVLKRCNHSESEFSYDIGRYHYVCDEFIKDHFKAAPKKIKLHFVENEADGLFMLCIKKSKFGEGVCNTDIRPWYGYAEKGYNKSGYIFSKMSSEVLEFLRKNGVTKKRIRFDVYMEDLDQGEKT